LNQTKILRLFQTRNGKALSKKILLTKAGKKCKRLLA